MPARPAAWFPHGTAYHFAIEEWENSRRALSKAALESLFRDMYQGGIAKLKEQWPEESDWLTGGNKKGNKDIEDREELGVWQVNDYVDFAEAHKDEWRIFPMPGGALATEVPFTITINGVVANGFIDQIREYRTGEIRPADLKSGSRDPGSTFQLGVYGQVIYENTGTRPDVGIFTKAGRPATAKVAEKPTKDVLWGLQDWTPELMGSMFKTMDTMDKLGLFLPNPQEGCERTCTVAAHCRIKGWAEDRPTFATIVARPREAADAA